MSVFDVREVVGEFRQPDEGDDAARDDPLMALEARDITSSALDP